MSVILGPGIDYRTPVVCLLIEDLDGFGLCLERRVVELIRNPGLMSRFHAGCGNICRLGRFYGLRLVVLRIVSAGSRRR